MDAPLDTSELGVRFLEMKRYVRLEADDVRHLRRLLPLAKPHFGRMVQIFYERIREHEDAFAVFGDESALGRMHGVLVDWLERILSGPYDDRYAEKSWSIGRVHVRVGMPQRYMFTAMSVFRQGLWQIAVDAPALDVVATGIAVDKILDIELALMSDAHGAATVERVQRLEREAASRKLGDMESGARRPARAFAMAACLIIGLDGEGRVVLLNDRARDLLGFDPGELEGRRLRASLLSEGGERWDELFRTALGARERTSFPLEISLSTWNGRIRRIEGFLARDPASELLGEPFVVFTGKDVTDEEALLARVRQSERLAAVGTLAAGLAHEIRNPLNGAQLHLTYIERALARNARGDDLGEAIAVVSAEIARLSALVNEFLDFARPAKPITEPTDLKRLCRQVAKIAKAEEGYVSLSLELPESDLVADVDPHKIEQVVLNLVRNAFEACAGTAGHVRVHAYREPRFAVVEVHDDGPGFSEDAPIFDAFFSTKAQGTGMGLAIAHRIVEDHGGSIEAHARAGDTLFRVRLPILEETH